MIRRGTLEDIDALVSLRCAMWNEMHPNEPADESMRSATAAYLRSELTGDRVRAWMAFVGEEAVGLALLLVHEHPPRIAGREIRGYVTAVFVAREHRRKGLGAEMLRAIVEHARASDFRRLMLRTSEAGRRVYESTGFTSMEVLAQDFAPRG